MDFLFIQVCSVTNKISFGILVLDATYSWGVSQIFIAAWWLLSWLFSVWLSKLPTVELMAVVPLFALEVL